MDILEDRDKGIFYNYVNDKCPVCNDWSINIFCKSRGIRFGYFKCPKCGEKLMIEDGKYYSVAKRTSIAVLLIYIVLSVISIIFYIPILNKITFWLFIISEIFIPNFFLSKCKIKLYDGRKNFGYKIIYLIVIGVILFLIGELFYINL